MFGFGKKKRKFLLQHRSQVKQYLWSKFQIQHLHKKLLVTELL